MKVVHEFGQVRASGGGGPVALVPTMGFLHEGHLSLIRAAALRHKNVVVSVFVNPTQFGDASDLESYPADIERDVALAEQAGATVVFAPSRTYMYPNDAETMVNVGSGGAGMEGDFRPGHFAGVATVVAKLFAGCQPDSAYFGRKDAQQLAVVRSMAEDLSFPVDVVGMPIIREADGLALSSRNVQLDDVSRQDASVVSAALFAACELFEGGESDVRVLTDRVRSVAHASGSVDIEYVEIADARSAEVVSHLGTLDFLAIAAKVGGVRLIDNVTLDSLHQTADRGEALSAPSILYGGI